MLLALSDVGPHYNGINKAAPKRVLAILHSWATRPFWLDFLESSFKAEAASRQVLLLISFLAWSI